jgi:hypothetical protein
MCACVCVCVCKKRNTKNTHTNMHTKHKGWRGQETDKCMYVYVCVRACVCVKKETPKTHTQSCIQNTHTPAKYRTQHNTHTYTQQTHTQYTHTYTHTHTHTKHTLIHNTDTIHTLIHNTHARTHTIHTQYICTHYMQHLRSKKGSIKVCLWGPLCIIQAAHCSCAGSRMMQQFWTVLQLYACFVMYI